MQNLCQENKKGIKLIRDIKREILGPRKEEILAIYNVIQVSIPNSSMILSEMW